MITGSTDPNPIETRSALLKKSYLQLNTRFDMVPIREPDDAARDDCEQLPAPTILPFDSKDQLASAPRPSRNQITFQSRQMNELIQQAGKFARSGASVLITGESGTGKELLSRLIHEQSNRRNQRYVAVNCAAMPEMLAESEFFGHERGAFTGAFQQRIGHFQQAHNGTILLDEISEIPASIQAKLLRVIEEQEVQRIGSNHCEKIDVRIIATSNRNLKKETAAGSFRLDLYHRLNVLRLEIPPLRQRLDDIQPLVEHFIELFRFENERQPKSITSAAMQKLRQYSWPGNIRELRNVIHRACVICNSQQITVDCLLQMNEDVSTAPVEGRMLADVEQQMILASLKKFGGNKTLAATELGVTPRTITNKLKLYRGQNRKAA
jgi:DNA-binding NtrC family response regulator